MGIHETLDSLLWYRTVKIVQIRNWKLGLVHYGIQLIIIAYIIGWVIVYKKGYQGQGPMEGTASTKVKGVAYLDLPNGTQEIWDCYDAVYPAMEQDALFVTTNVYQTLAQTRSVCPGDVHCNEATPCPVNSLNGSGITNGTCDYNTSACWMNAWCPVEHEPKVTANYLNGVENFTVFIKINVMFPTYHIGSSNTNGSETSPNYNLFTVKAMLDGAGTTIDEVKQKGGIILVSSDWDCNLDNDISECIPTVSFTRIDQTATFSPGFNFRYVNYYAANGESYRDLTKVYGIRFLMLISGTGKKFDIVPLLVNIASGLALLSIATVVADLVALYVHPQRKFYQESKFEDAKLGKHPLSMTTPLLNDKT